MKGLFIPGITSEMFRNGCLESIEALMAEGKIYDIEYSRWIPVSERLPEPYQNILVTSEVFHWVNEPIKYSVEQRSFGGVVDFIAWMPLPEPYKAESEG